MVNTEIKSVSLPKDLINFLDKEENSDLSLSKIVQKAVRDLQEMREDEKGRFRVLEIKNEKLIHQRNKLLKFVEDKGLTEEMIKANLF